jgi:uncharacterized paraquat-inducible protein A
MQNGHNAHSIATALGASSQHQSSLSKKTLARCQCCDAALNFVPVASAAAISCIVCGHQNQSSWPNRFDNADLTACQKEQLGQGEK